MSSGTIVFDYYDDNQISLSHPLVYIFEVNGKREYILASKNNGVIQYIEINLYNIRSVNSPVITENFGYAPANVRELNLKDEKDCVSFYQFIMPAFVKMKKGEILEEGLYHPGFPHVRSVAYPAVKKISNTVFEMDHHIYGIVEEHLYPALKIDPRNIQNDEQHKALIALLQQTDVNVKLKVNTLYPIKIEINGKIHIQYVVLTNAIIKVQKQNSKDFSYPIIDRETIDNDGNFEEHTKKIGKGTTAKTISSSYCGEIVDDQFIAREQQTVFKTFRYTSDLDIKNKIFYEDESVVQDIQNELEIFRDIYPETYPVILQTVKGNRQILMPNLPGKTLAAMLKNNKLQNMRIDEVFTMAEAILIALDKFHKKGYVHGDISLGNIKYDIKTQTAYLLDFGNSKHKKFVTTEKRGGTREFMAPEVSSSILNHTAVPNIAKSDIYSLGVILDMIVNKKFNDSTDSSNVENPSDKDTLMKSQMNTLILYMKTIDHNLRPNACDVLSVIQSKKNSIGNTIQCLVNDIKEKNKELFIEGSLNADPKNKAQTISKKIAALEKFGLSTKEINDVENTQALLINLFSLMKETNYNLYKNKSFNVDGLMQHISHLSLNQLQLISKIILLSSEILEIEKIATPDKQFLCAIVEKRKSLALLFAKLWSDHGLSKYFKLFEPILFPKKSEHTNLRNDMIAKLDDKIDDGYLKLFYANKRIALEELQDFLVYGCQNMSAGQILNLWEKIEHLDKNGKLCSNAACIDHFRFFKTDTNTTATRDFINQLKTMTEEQSKESSIPNRNLTSEI